MFDKYPGFDAASRKSKVTDGRAWAVGNTMIFFKQEVFILLEKTLFNFMAKVQSKVAATFRMVKVKKKYQAIRAAIITLQRSFHNYRRVKLKIKFQQLFVVAGRMGKTKMLAAEEEQAAAEAARR